jgi:rubrerythrin
MATGVEEAIRTALEFEAKVRDVYAQAVTRSTDPAARSTLQVLAGEEQSHLDFLHAKLEEWKKSGRVSAEKLAMTLPSKEALSRGRQGLRKQMQLSAADRAKAEATLRMAVTAEAEVGAFYKRMVDELPAESRPLFARFLEIESGHLAIVQAELDSVTGLGYWFDVQEFRLEAE